VIAPDSDVVAPDDAMPPDSSIDGTGPDAPSDAPADALDAALDAADAPEAGMAYTNICPRGLIAGGPVDCHPFASADHCCRKSDGSAYLCGMPGGACEVADDKFTCTGRFWCGTLYCCATPTAQSPRSSVCMTSCASYLCGHNDDCPPGLPYCSAIYLPMTLGGPLRQCSATP
jgi:hypothetical protein